MEIIQKFGLETKLFLFQLINFSIIVFILKKFLYKPLEKILDERKNKIEQSLRDSENAKIALDNAGEEAKKIIATAKSNADKLMVSIKVSNDETKEKAKEEAKQCSEKILEDARCKALAEFEVVNKQIGKISIDISSKILSKILSDLFTDDEKQKLMLRVLDKMYEKNTN
ncbi:MAG: F0F1 ATP synthase subunit B [Endomicrobium sp.]|jgi:F-type H+-transporting ATPase subunit b|nr:F0F1 ATP synthase subunit B [Endomicrobium sp.]